MELIAVVEDVFNRPPIPFNPSRQSPKGWAMYCLRDRGFMVVTAQNADFAIHYKGKKVYFKVSDSADNLDDPSVGWILVDPSGQKARVIAPQKN